MITANKSVVHFEGTAKDLTFEFTHIILGFKENMIKEFGLTEDEIHNVIKICGEIAFMSNEERQEYIDILMDKENE